MKLFFKNYHHVESYELHASQDNDSLLVLVIWRIKSLGSQMATIKAL